MTYGKTLIVMLTFAVIGTAQEKPVPVQREIGVSTPDSLARPSAPATAPKTTQALPKFDIPEYVITGVAAIDLPDAEKQDAAEVAQALELADPVASLRDRAAFDFSLDPKIMMGRPGVLLENGRLLVSSGTYMTSKVNFLHNIVGTDYFVGLEGNYGMAKAYVPFANRSGGDFRIRGGATLGVPGAWFDRGFLGGDLGYGTASYRFFGSDNPSVTRTSTQLHLSANYDSPQDLAVLHHANVGLALQGVKDSTTSVTETLFDLGGGIDFFVGTLPLNFRVDFTLASLSASSSNSLPFLDGQIATEKFWYGDFSLRAALHGYVAQGMLGQKFARAYPHVTMGYRFAEGNIVSISYEGRVEQHTLTSLLRSMPYISAGATIRQSDIPIDVKAEIETEWSPVWRTRLAARYQTVRDMPLFTEGLSKGMWTTDFRGTTRIYTTSAELFAKFDANSYFTAAVEANDSKNTLTTGKVPYLPDVRVSCGAWVEPLPRLTVSPMLTYVGRRGQDVLTTTKLPGYLSAELHASYLLMQSLSVGLDVLNLTNARTDVWRNYRTAPFTLTGGISLRW